MLFVVQSLFYCRSQICSETVSQGGCREREQRRDAQLERQDAAGVERSPVGQRDLDERSGGGRDRAAVTREDSDVDAEAAGIDRGELPGERRGASGREL